MSATKNLFYMSLISLGLAACSRQVLPVGDYQGDREKDDKLEILLKDKSTLTLMMDKDGKEGKIVQEGNDLILEDKKNKEIYRVQCPEGKAAWIVMTCDKFTANDGSIMLKSAMKNGKSGFNYNFTK